MTEHIPDDELDQRLADYRAALHADLDRVIDLDAGLTDAALPGRAQEYTHDLDQVLDLDAGLAAILPTRPVPDAPSDGGERTGLFADDTRDVARLLHFARSLASKPAVDRLYARLWLPQTALNEVRLLINIDRTTRENLRHHIGVLERDVSNIFSSEQNRELLYELDRVHTYARELFSALTSTAVPDHMRHLARKLVNGLADARRYTRTLGYGDDRIEISPRMLSDALFAAQGLDYALDLRKILLRLSKHCRDMYPSQLSTRPTMREFGNAAAADEVASEAHEEDLAEAVDLMDRAVSDMVGADLGDADLDDIPLAGVRWSSMTRWPLGWVDFVHRTSTQIGTDLWQVREPHLGTDHLVQTL